VSEPLVAGSLPCPQCGTDAEPEEDGQILWFACPQCGAEFGYQPVPLAGPLCAAGLSIRVDDAQPPGVLSLESGSERTSVFLGATIRRRPE
jgi:predicted RNA-binding Zn-ribbon protein involved in translation (DUF1610 family)